MARSRLLSYVLISNYHSIKCMKTYERSKKTGKLFAALILAKSHSKRLPGKNTLDFHGDPMFLVNVKKCLSLFEKVYVSTNDYDIYKKAILVGAEAIIRGEELCGDTPNIPVYQHAMKQMPDIDGIVAVQSNSPTVDPRIIKTIKIVMEEGAQEVMTCHSDRKIYGSVWALS